MHDALAALANIACEYALPGTLGSALNLASAAGLWLLVRQRSLSRALGIGACVLAGPLGGFIAVAEGYGAVALLGWQGEPAGLALAFSPLVLAPSAIGCLAWLVGQLTWSQRARPALSLVGALTGSVVAMTLLFAFLFGDSKLVHLLQDALPRMSSLFTPWCFIGPVVAGGAFAAQALVRYADRLATN